MCVRMSDNTPTTTTTTTTAPPPLLSCYSISLSLPPTVHPLVVSSYIPSASLHFPPLPRLSSNMSVTFEAGHIYRPGQKEEVRLVYRIRGGPDNGRHQKSFSITRYGLEGAFAVAERAKEYINSTNRLPLDFYNPYSIKNIASTFSASSLEPGDHHQEPPPPNRKRKQTRTVATTPTPIKRHRQEIKDETKQFLPPSPGEVYYPESTTSTADSSPLPAPICFVQYLPSSSLAPFSFYPYATPFHTSPPLGAEEFLFSPVLNSYGDTSTAKQEEEEKAQQQPPTDNGGICCSSPVRLSALL
eukprot:GHVS01094455.1.p1 GENE.GHVS01094455.1~~GHVS01094455.1.p1  ORF type:complete len:300 (-),score=74.79 GHVS01094455.1:842-1741(-)